MKTHEVDMETDGVEEIPRNSEEGSGFRKPEVVGGLQKSSRGRAVFFRSPLRVPYRC
jgi:hypothetical protein